MSGTLGGRSQVAQAVHPAPGPQLQPIGGIGGWQALPDLTVANGVIYGPYARVGYAVGDNAGSVYFFPGTGSINCFVRLDRPFTAWFQMWCDPWQAMTEFGEVFSQNDQIILVPQAGAGGARYDRSTPDLGDAFNDGSTGPWESTSGNYDDPVPTSFSTWHAILGGIYEGNIAYCAAAQDSTGRWYIVGPRRQGGFDATFAYPRDTIALAADYSGYLDPGAVHAHRIADLPDSGGDIQIEGHSACCDRAGNLYVAGGLNSSGAIDSFRRYTPGPPVGAGVVDIQRVRLVGGVPSATDRYEIADARDSFTNSTGLIERQDNQATVQAAYNSYFGPGVVTIAGTGADHTVTRLVAGAAPQLTIGGVSGFPNFNGDPDMYVDITHTQHGTGYPSTNTWTELAPLPAPRFQGVLVADNASRIYYVGGCDAGGTPVGTTYRYNPLTDTWTQLADLPDSLVTASLKNTSGESQPGFLHSGRVLVMAYTPAEDAMALCVYIPGTDHWLTPIYTLTPHVRGGVTLAGGYVYAISGYSNPGTNTLTSSAERIRV